ncbi:MAG: UbiD family decarboxylase [Betaproteobacteria bacterium]|nr:UbiD family decarboxylase [Betaproteobacteria bacterium]
MGYYKDLREQVAALEKAGKLQRIDRPINKDTELQPLVRLQFRGLPESQRKAWYFSNVVDSKGRKYDMPVVLGASAASSEIYGIGMQCPVDRISERWIEAQANPIPPRTVSAGPAQEVVHGGEAIRREGLAMLPVPIATPGFDNAPYTSASNWITVDPDTGIRNVGNYRGQIKAPDRLGCFAGSKGQGVYIHWLKWKAKRKPMPVAAVIGVPPNISYAAVTKFPDDVDELAVAGGLAGEAVEMVKCKTIDLLVPAYSEIVIEGYMPTDSVEPEGPFGEFTGYMAARAITLFMEVTAITHRRNPLYQGFVSQFPPSESSKIRQISWEQLMMKILKVDHGLDNVLEVAYNEATGAFAFCVVKIRKRSPDDAKRIFDAYVKGLGLGKIVVVVDEDVDARDPESVLWATSYRMQPHRDVEIRDCTAYPLDYSVASPVEGGARGPASEQPRSSLLCIDATTKWPYPPTSLPSRPIMENAVKIWETEGLPPLSLKNPWWGYPLGYWPEENREEAELALASEYFKTGVRNMQGRTKA